MIDEAPGVRTFRFDNRQRAISLDLPGRFAKVCVPHENGEIWRAFTISSSPARPDWLDLTIKLNPHGVVTPYLFGLEPGSKLRLRGPQGGYYFDPHRLREPLALVSAGSGVTPMLSIVRWLKDQGDLRSCRFLHGARTEADVLLGDECRRLAAEWPDFLHFVTLSQPSSQWRGACGRLDTAMVLEQVPDAAQRRWFLCGPNGLMDQLRHGLQEAGVDAAQIHTEQFHANPASSSPSASPVTVS
ncbi:MAG: hypothetical protein KDB14_02650 [Planctomycetales bacterium]|nr:hypothetical protein [Planctomycetales bacterium]